MKQQRLVVMLVVVLLSAVAVLGLTGVVAAQGDTPTNETTSTTTTTTTTTTQTETADESDDGLTVPAEDIWKKYREDQNKTSARENEIIATLGPGAWVTGFTLDKENETARITITQRTTRAYTFSDTNSADRSEEVSYITYRKEQMPRGTYSIVVPATLAKDGNQQVCITGNENWPCLSNGVVENNDPLSKLISLRTAIGAIIMFLVGIIARVGYKVYRQQENGLPESMDGTTLQSPRVGVKDDE